ncbi:hypothetical protein B5S32_g4513 [[Candida] boidinii]|nr:hypothetical protein B5S32_g4513 [[Candida] boidinii]
MGLPFLGEINRRGTNEASSYEPPSSPAPSIPPSPDPSAPSANPPSRITSMSSKKVPPPPPPPVSAGERKSSEIERSNGHRVFSFGGHHKQVIDEDDAEEKQNIGSNLRKINAAAYTISGSSATASNATNSTSKITIDDSKYAYSNADSIPRPRKFEGNTKLYPSGRGSSVPLNLSLYE